MDADTAPENHAIDHRSHFNRLSLPDALPYVRLGSRLTAQEHDFEVSLIEGAK
jgi:hypothetical protein